MGKGKGLKGRFFSNLGKIKMAEITIGVLASVAAAVVTTPLEGLRMKLVSMEKVPKNSDMKSRQDNGHHDLKRLVLGRSLRSLSTEIMPGLPILSYYAVSSGIRLGFFGSMQNRGFLTQNLNERRYFIRSIVVASGTSYKYNQCKKK
jgi:hypothetical protein